MRNIPAEEVAKIREYASRGGRVLIVPESFLGDEYNRAQGYDQSFSQDVVFALDAPVRLEGAPGGLEIQGMRQNIEVSGDTQVR
ncbi:MAG: hypothetical protein AAB225_16020 [Acidobacteriota bacterium]